MRRSEDAARHQPDAAPKPEKAETPRRVTTCDSVRLLKETVWVHWDLPN
jgi:hypothetical protein